MTDNARRTGAAVEATYQFLLWLVPTVEKFPRSQKFVLGDRIESTAISVLEGLVDATYTKARGRALAEVNIALERLRFLVRLAFDLKHLDPRRYEFAARGIDEIGGYVGAWIKTDRAAQG